MLSQYFLSLWNTELLLSGKVLITFLVFNITFMMMGRFRFNLISTLFLIFYIIFFANRKLIDQYFDDTGLAALFVVFGTLFLVMAIWSFFIESD